MKTLDALLNRVLGKSAAFGGEPDVFDIFKLMLGEGNRRFNNPLRRLLRTKVWAGPDRGGAGAELCLENHGALKLLANCVVRCVVMRFMPTRLDDIFKAKGPACLQHLKLICILHAFVRALG